MTNFRRRRPRRVVNGRCGNAGQSQPYDGPHKPSDWCRMQEKAVLPAETMPIKTWDALMEEHAWMEYEDDLRGLDTWKYGERP